MYEEEHPGEVMVVIAVKDESRLIVVGLRGFGTFERIAFGSVSTYITHHAHCPILLEK